MSSSPRNLLPHGARGFTFGPGALVFAKDKIVLDTGDGGHTHLTVHLGSASQVLDLHETCMAPDGSKIYRTLFTITHTQLALMLQDIAPDVLKGLSSLLRPLRIGWMARRRVAAVVGLIPDDSELEKVTEKRRGKLLVNENQLAARAKIPEFLEELYDLSDGAAFTLFDARNAGSARMIGIGFKYTDSVARPRLVWFRFADIGDVSKLITARLQEAAGRYGEVHVPLPWYPVGSPPNKRLKLAARGD